MENISKKSFWHHHIEEWSKSNLSQVEYCRTHTIALSTFGYWKRKLNGTQKYKPVFYPLAISPEPSIQLGVNKSGLTLHFKDRKFSLEIDQEFSEATLTQVVATLDQL